MQSKHKLLFADIVRFLFAGGFNTLLTLCIYQLCLFIFDHNIAYSLSWLCGLLFVYFYYPSKVFPGSNPTPVMKILTVVIYLFVYLAGLFFLNVFIEKEIHERVAILFVIILSTLLNFCLMRLLLRRNKL